MLKIILPILFGVLGGVVSGMGMGGGTVLIPLLTLLSTVDQRLAQSINLLAFIPTSIVALILHAKNKLVKWKDAIVFAIPSVITSVLASLLVPKLGSKFLSSAFGVFLLILGIVRLKNAIKEKKSVKPKKQE